MSTYKNTKKSVGVIYCITNPAWEGWVKIGISTYGIEDRLKSYNTGSPFRDYELRFTMESSHVLRLEKDVHKTLRRHGHDNNSEWFKVEIDEAIKIIRAVHKFNEELYNG